MNKHIMHHRPDTRNIRVILLVCEAASCYDAARLLIVVPGAETKMKCVEESNNYIALLPCNCFAVMA